MVSKYKLQKLGYTIFEENERLNAFKVYKNINAIIIIKNNEIIRHYITYYVPIESQEEIDNLQIAFNRLQSDIKELKNGKNK